MKKNMKLLIVDLVTPEKSTFVKPENLSLFIKEKSCSNFMFIAVDERIKGIPGKRIQIKINPFLSNKEAIDCILNFFNVLSQPDQHKKEKVLHVTRPVRGSIIDAGIKKMAEEIKRNQDKKKTIDLRHFSSEARKKSYGCDL